MEIISLNKKTVLLNGHLKLDHKLTLLLVQKLIQEDSFREIENNIVDCIRRNGVEIDSLETQIPKKQSKNAKN